MKQTSKTKQLSSLGAVIDDDAMPLLLRLPPELLPTLVEASASPLLTYMLLLSLCRATRTAVRGTPRELSFCFDGGDADVEPLIVAEVTVPTPDALAALVGPCKGLVELTLPGDDDALVPLGCRPEEAACAPWVIEAFGGHDRLAVLHVPSAALILPLPGIVSHLPALVELRIGGPDPFTVMTRRVPQEEDPERPNHVPPVESLRAAFSALLVALGRSCPRLRVLHHHTVGPLQEGTDTDGNLLSIVGALTDLHLPLGGLGDLPFTADLITSMASVQRLNLNWCHNTMLRPVASRLRHLGLRDPVSCEGLDEVGLCQLESLSLWSYVEEEAFSRLVGANMHTLRSVTLGFAAADALLRVLGPLNGLPHLTDLTLIIELPINSRGTPPPLVLDWVFLTCLTPGLLDRLEHLAVHLPSDRTPCLPTGPTLRLASRRLRTLCLSACCVRLDETTLELACPCLEVLALPEDDRADLGGLVLDCPQLRSIEGVLQGGRGHAPSGPGAGKAGASRVGGVPAGSAPGLGSPHHQRTHRCGESRTLRLPAQLERLDVEVDCWTLAGPSQIELRVEAAGLRSLALQVSAFGGVRLVLGCPALIALDLGAPLIDFRLADPSGPVPPLVSLALTVASFSRATQNDWAGCLVAMLGARLRRVCLKGTFPALPQLATALGRLPRLAELRLEDITSPTATWRWPARP
ncbi:hypothetical protein PAPYR_9239 [Paratrimastix pyriformis]|uniref:F-box domain-containing protein n=1 Tax=Paratrimastix pyriformis TaxID=342808 RepID=A0ABQ8UG12_9EUKA|nr:hypothetical protein PAPYR_9239 [Paratrimastix pyriformis]